MWIFCGGMPRSGSTLQFQLTAHLVEQLGLGMRVEWVRPAEFPRLRAKYADYPGWKVFKTHRCSRDVVAEFAAMNAKGVYIFRDVRDVVVSRMRKSGQPFDILWKAGFVNRILKGFDRWTSLDGVLVSRYEIVVGDLAGEVCRIATHLGLAVSAPECERVARDYTIPRQRERIREAVAGGGVEWSGEAYYDPVSNLHTDHIHSGQIGDWRTVLAADELAVIEDRAQEWLPANGYPLSLGRWRRAILKRQYARRRRRALVHGWTPRRRPAVKMLASGNVPALVLTCDRYRAFSMHMIRQYQRVWPSHPFTFHVPYQEQPLDGPGIVARRTPEAIRATVLELLRDFDDDDWIYWCIDDKYPMCFVEEPVITLAQTVRSGGFRDIDGLLLCRCRRLLRPERLLDERMAGPAGIVLLRRRDYSQIWIHQFLRAKVLRHLFGGFPEWISRARAMDQLKDRAVLPGHHRLYVVERNLAVFGESTIGARVTRNCASSLRALGMDVPPGFEEADVERVMGVI